MYVFIIDWVCTLLDLNFTFEDFLHGCGLGLRSSKICFYTSWILFVQVVYKRACTSQYEFVKIVILASKEFPDPLKLNISFCIRLAILNTSFQFEEIV